jgi:ParB family chromosome partitioning protein
VKNSDTSDQPSDPGLNQTDTLVIFTQGSQDQEAIVIGDLYRRARGSMVGSIKYLAEAGRRLITKKESLKHGEWLPWLQANADALGFENRSTAQRLMMLGAKWCASASFDEAEALRLNRLAWGHNVRGTQGTGENEWFTPPEYIELARSVLGDIDLDPATHKQAQKTIRATNYFTKAEDGLTKEWCGRVWLNPPYAQPLIAHFVSKMVSERLAGHVTAAIMLTHNYTDTAWFHEAAITADAICFMRGRVKFYELDGEIAAPTQGQAFFYFGSEAKKFANQFASIGFVVRRIWVET